MDSPPPTVLEGFQQAPEQSEGQLQHASLAAGDTGRFVSQFMSVAAMCMQQRSLYRRASTCAGGFGARAHGAVWRLGARPIVCLFGPRCSLCNPRTCRPVVNEQPLPA
jgi:hypothetical protein